MTIAENIKAIRKKNGMTQKQLAELIGVSVGAVQQFEYGKIEPKMDTLLLMANKLNISARVINPDIHWDDYIDVESLKEEVKIWDKLPHYDEDDIEVFTYFLSLNSEGKEKVFEYIKDLIPKYQEK